MKSSNSIPENEWILIAPNGALAMARTPQPLVPEGARIATGPELVCANRGQPFPWGHLPEPNPNNRQWSSRCIGVGGLIHEKWFVTTDGRFGGAANVPQTLPGSLRSCIYLDGGPSLSEGCLAENEGYAVVKSTTEADRLLYRQITHYAATHVMADGGAIVMSPIDSHKRVYVGFVGRCQICPNPELISFPQLQRRFPELSLQLWPEWSGWSLAIPQTHSSRVELPIANA